MADDRIATKFVQADDAVLKERIVWKLGFGIGLLGLVELVGGSALAIMALVSGATAPAVPGAILAISGLFMTVVGILAGVLRIAVTPSALRVQFMTSAIEIPFERLRSIRAEDYDWTTYGGWGYRISLSGKRAMSVTGVGNRGLALVYEDDSGKERSLFVSSKDPEAVIRAVESVTGAAGVFRVRVPEIATDDREDRADEAEQEGAPEETRGRR